MFHETPLYEFNRFAPWELFCSTYRSYKEAEGAKSPIERLHHNRGLLLFSFAYLEALLNYVVQREANGEDVEKLVRWEKLSKKLDYLEGKIGSPIDRTELDKINKEYGYLRNEVVHFKRTDQQPQFHVQHIQPAKFMILIERFSLRVFLPTHREFPYWLTGWNYTGFNGNWRDLYLSNNGNGFGHSLDRMGFRFKPMQGAGTLGFAQAHMSTFEHYDEIRRFLDIFPADAEPISATFPMRPRLLRKWWCQTSLHAAEGDVMRASGWSKE